MGRTSDFRALLRSIGSAELVTSGAHFNPAVTAIFALRKELSVAEAFNFRTPDIGACSDVRSDPGQAAAAVAFSALRLAGVPGKASPMRPRLRTANRIRRQDPGKTVAVLLRISHRA